MDSKPPSAKRQNKGILPIMDLGRDTLRPGIPRKVRNPSREAGNLGDDTTRIATASPNSFYNQAQPQTPFFHRANVMKNDAPSSGKSTISIDLDSDLENPAMSSATKPSKGKGKQRDNGNNEDNKDNDGDMEVSVPKKRKTETYDFFDEIPQPKSTSGVRSAMTGKDNQKEQKRVRKPRGRPRRPIEVVDDDDEHKIEVNIGNNKVIHNQTLRDGYSQGVDLKDVDSSSILYLDATHIDSYHVESSSNQKCALTFSKERLIINKLLSRRLEPWRVIDLTDVVCAKGRYDSGTSALVLQLKKGSNTVESLPNPRISLSLDIKVDDNPPFFSNLDVRNDLFIAFISDTSSFSNNTSVNENLFSALQIALRNRINWMSDEEWGQRKPRGKIETKERHVGASKPDDNNLNTHAKFNTHNSTTMPHLDEDQISRIPKVQSDIENFTQDDGQATKKARQTGSQVSKAKKVAPQPIVPGAARASQTVNPSSQQSKDHENNEYTNATSGGEAPMARTRSTRKAKSDAIKANNELKGLTGTSARKPSMDPAVANEIYLTKDFDNGSLTIRRGDRASIDPGEFLNDCIVEYGIRLRSRDPVLADQVHLFSSFFYTSLVNSYEGTGDPYKTMWRWTKSVDIFAKKFILVPICENLHWYLAVIYNPKGVLFGPPGDLREKKKPKPKPSAGAATSAAAQKRQAAAKKREEKKQETSKNKVKHDIVELSSDSENEQEKDKDVPEKPKDEDVVMSEVTSTQNTPSQDIPDSEAVEIVGNVEEDSKTDDGDADVMHEDRNKNSRCYIFTLDSLSGTHRPVINNLSRYLQMEAQGRKGLPLESFSVPDGKNPKVPKQPNWCDCGVYVIHYIDVFFKDTTKYLGLLLNSHKTRREHSDPQWEDKAAERAREHLVKSLDEEAVKFDAEEIRKGRREPKKVVEQKAENTTEESTESISTKGNVGQSTVLAIPAESNNNGSSNEVEKRPTAQGEDIHETSSNGSKSDSISSKVQEKLNINNQDIQRGTKKHSNLNSSNSKSDRSTMIDDNAKILSKQHNEMGTLPSKSAVIEPHIGQFGTANQASRTDQPIRTVMEKIRRAQSPQANSSQEISPDKLLYDAYNTFNQETIANWQLKGSSKSDAPQLKPQHRRVSSNPIKRDTVKTSPVSKLSNSQAAEMALSDNSPDLLRSQINSRLPKYTTRDEEPVNTNSGHEIDETVMRGQTNERSTMFKPFDTPYRHNPPLEGQLTREPFTQKHLRWEGEKDDSPECQIIVSPGVNRTADYLKPQSSPIIEQLDESGVEGRRRLEPIKQRGVDVSNPRLSPELL
ncbi:hypothetical protein E3Q03_02445 [Wallemia mellicola]|uniref:Ubiquitin-like protease family profile domain-containing protein n=1 Tax=Wallemia mellicola TaxID=1708541 RepID=A0AB74KDS3_9BASI|nr:hypothetical protein E3Q03_02445 [Wallemia mellicola]